MPLLLPVLLTTLFQRSLAITHGEEIEPHSAPYQAYIIFNSKLPSISTCGGTLITPNFVLTSGHCVFSKIEFDVILGAHNISEPEESQVNAKGLEYVVHPLYNSSLYHYDIALIQLQHEVELNDFINFATLPLDKDASVLAQYALIYGWGITSHDYYCKTSDVLLRTMSTVVENSWCSNRYGEMLDNEICLSGEGGRGACQGDQGGPLIVEGIQYGVISYFPPGCQSGSPTVFVRIASFLDWIEANSDWKRA